MTEREAYLAFSTFPAVGPQRFKLLREYFGSAKEAWEAQGKELEQLGVGEKLLAKFVVHRKAFSLEKYEDRLGKLGVEYVTVEEPEYPERLKKIDDAPFLLYVKAALGLSTRGPVMRSRVILNGVKDLSRMRGSADKLRDSSAAPQNDEVVYPSMRELSEVSVAVVGTRKISSYGRDVTERIVAGLVDAGVTIVSGLALGIDAVAHKTALECGGFTIGVVGGGLDSIYPPANRGLAERMIKEGRGMIVSEYPLGFPAMPQNFPVRNRIVSGMVLGVLVVEGTTKSGTLITAATAAKQGRDVFAVPGPITSAFSAAPHLLIKNGARLVEKAEDILEELDVNSKIQITRNKQTIPETVEEKKLLDLLEVERLSLDELVRMSGMETGTVLSTLTGMELKGMVKNVGGSYVKV